jgi:hypothetical protein
MSKRKRSTASHVDTTQIMETIYRKTIRDRASGKFFSPERRLEAIRANGFDDYESYIKSGTWHRKRAEMFTAGMPTHCVICSAAPVRLHHVDYRRITKERFYDLIPVCNAHHDQIHGLLRLLNTDITNTFHIIRVMMKWSVRNLNHALEHYHVQMLTDAIRQKTGQTPHHYPMPGGKNIAFRVDDRLYVRLEIPTGQTWYGKQARPVREYVQNLHRCMKPQVPG